MSGPVLLDNTVLSNLAVVERPELVFQLWPEQVTTTEAVLREYQVGAQAASLAADAWQGLSVVVLTPAEVTAAEVMSRRLGWGESSCLAAARARAGLFVSDDAAARAAARRMGIPVSGTLGVLVLAVRKGLLVLAEANALLSEMVAAGYRSPVEALDRLV